MSSLEKMSGALPLGMGTLPWMDKQPAGAGRSRRAMLAIRRKILRKLSKRIRQDLISN
jgi:hypothetical protein